MVLVLAAALLVNLRMAIYSAALAPHLGAAPLWKRATAAYLMVDNAYAVAIAEYTRAPERPVAWKMAYYFGGALPVCGAWYAATLVGALTGQAIPDSWSLDLAVPIAFIALLAPLVRNLAQLAAVMTSVVAALALAAMPYNTELLVAAALGMLVGAEVERRQGP